LGEGAGAATSTGTVGGAVVVGAAAFSPGQTEGQMADGSVYLKVMDLDCCIGLNM